MKKKELFNLNFISDKIIGAAIQVHRFLGPGMLESIYKRCLCRELSLLGLKFETEKSINIYYKSFKLDHAFKADIIVNNQIILELKTVKQIIPVHESQLLSYLRLTNCKLGLLINFHAPVLKNGIRRFING
ncbi:MAG: GxxExxY protein [Spirochaetales bacterium]|nr:GxxExxY protein [Spirochaetales bacterium]